MSEGEHAGMFPRTVMAVRGRRFSALLLGFGSRLVIGRMHPAEQVCLCNPGFTLERLQDGDMFVRSRIGSADQGDVTRGEVECGLSPVLQEGQSLKRFGTGAQKSDQIRI